MTQEKPKDAAAPWSGRFNEPATELVKRYTASVGFDRRLAEFDIECSLAHARMRMPPQPDAGTSGHRAGTRANPGRIRRRSVVARPKTSHEHRKPAGRDGRTRQAAAHCALAQRPVATDVRLFCARRSMKSTGSPAQHGLLDSPAGTDTIMPGFRIFRSRNRYRRAPPMACRDARARRAAATDAAARQPLPLARRHWPAPADRPHSSP